MKRIRLVLSVVFLLGMASSLPAAQLQVGAFKNQENIEDRTRQLEQMGYEVRHQETAGELTRIRTRDLDSERLTELRRKLDQHNINYRILGREPTPDYRPGDDSDSLGLPEGLPPISGYRRTLSDTLIQRLESVMGTEYVWGAESPSKGFDCSGLLHWLFRGETPRTVATLWPWTTRIQRDQLQPGDFIFFTFDSYEEPDHIGLYLGNGEFVHASSSYGVIQARLDKSYYRQNLYGYGRPNF
jgi:cell wall-associated NlpC family hydrolase